VLIVVGCTFGALVGAGMIAAIAAPLALLLLGIGVVQLLWIIPLSVHYRRIGETETFKGIVIMASIVFLLNAGCWGFVANLNFH
jgi:hypothetical protein